jgi:hypothetical protein
MALMCFVMVNNRFYRHSPEAYLNYYAENGEWEKALDYARRFSAQATIMTAHIVNHSLYHTGRLPHDMFDYPQFRNENVLLLRDEGLELSRSANRRSDVYYHLGRIDQAERWAHEVLTTQGFHGFALRRLVSINILKKRPKAARVYAGVMQKTVTHRNEAAELIAQLDKGELPATDKEIIAIRPLLPKTDYVGDWTTRDILVQQLRETPANRMAYEYLTAHLLITGDLMVFGQTLQAVEDFGHRKLPRAYEEACVAYMLVAKQPPPNLRLKVQKETIEKFDRFMALYRKHERDERKAWDVLKPEFGNAYWFFDVFGRSGSVQPPDFDRKQ